MNESTTGEAREICSDPFHSRTFLVSGLGNPCISEDRRRKTERGPLVLTHLIYENSHRISHSYLFQMIQSLIDVSVEYTRPEPAAKVSPLPASSNDAPSSPSFHCPLNLSMRLIPSLHERMRHVAGLQPCDRGTLRPE